MFNSKHFNLLTNLTNLGKISSNPFNLDLRSLALSRIALGFILLINFIISANNLSIFYTDLGLLPREALSIKYGGVRHFSLTVLSGDYWPQVFLISLGIISSISLIFGYFSRIAIFISWLIFLSFFNRNPLIIDGGDDALKLFLLLFCFLPIAKHFSIDKKSQPINNSYFSAACIALSIQIASVYFYSAILKTSPQWRVDGTALHYALALGVFTSSLGEQLLQYPELLKLITLATWWIELIAPLFLLVPFFPTFFRTLAFLIFVSFHIGLILFMQIGPFPWIMISAWLAFIPSYFWESKLGFKLESLLNKFFELIKIRNSATTEPAFLTDNFTNLFCYFFIVYITLWNIRSTDFDKYSKYFSSKLNFIGYSIRLDQYWALFAPFPSQEGGWDMQVGTLKNKKIVDLKTGNDLDLNNRPKNLSTHYKNFRWKKYILNTWDKTNSIYRKYYANYLCKTWNKSHSDEEKLEEVKLMYMLEKTLPPGIRTPRSFPQPNVIWKQSCD